ncbi:MAG: hypothetical protein KBD24_00945 [Candidatus Pacebacteria bacterium]|nr:hypothetical protein [Candidatus Paceibacterota bacterium]
MLITLAIEKAEFILGFLWKIFSRFFNFLSPIKILPKKTYIGDFTTIQSLQIINRSSQDVYDIYIGGISTESKDKFDVKIVSDNIPNAKTVEHGDINTNVLSILAEDPKTKNSYWVFRIHHMNPKDKLELKLKLKSTKTIYFKNLGFSFKEVHIQEWSDGRIRIPFSIRKLPKIIK